MHILLHFAVIIMYFIAVRVKVMYRNYIFICIDVSLRIALYHCQAQEGSRIWITYNFIQFMCIIWCVQMVTQ